MHFCTERLNRLLLAMCLMFAMNVLHSPGTNADQVPQSRAQINLSFAPLVKEAAPAVVNVYARRISRRSGFSPFSDDPFFRRFFGDDGLFGRPRNRVQNSLGSGVIVEESGFIVTNHHVIKGGTDIRVVLADKREFPAQLLVSDERTDLAVLKIEPGNEKLPYLQFGDADELAVGDLVLAIGNPFGVGQTVTSGIVSALARTRVGVSDYQFFIQTDAAINPGNSGGALVDMNGNLVGINTAIYSRSGGSVGIGFAIPSNMVRSVIFSARGGGKIVRPWSGVEVQEVTSDIAESLGFAKPAGALVVDLHTKSPLAAAGIKRGDVLTAVDGRKIGSARELDYRLATRQIGKTVDITYLRRGQKHTAQVALIPPPEDPPRTPTLIRGSSPLTGLVVGNLSPAVSEELGLGGDDNGVVVLEVKRGPAQRVGFRPGDIIVEVNARSIGSVGSLNDALRQSDGWWDLAIKRDGRIRRIQLGE